MSRGADDSPSTSRDDSDDYILVNGVPVKVRGDGSIDDESTVCSDDDDIVIGSAVVDTLRGLLGDDAIRGRGSDDLLAGDDGDDDLRGGGGDDVIDGGRGADRLAGGRGSNRYLGCADGFADVIVIRSDGGSPDLIEGLDTNDRILIRDAAGLLSFQAVDGGLAILAAGQVEVIVSGSTPGLDQLQAITTLLG